MSDVQTNQCRSGGNDEDKEEKLHGGHQAVSPKLRLVAPFYTPSFLASQTHLHMRKTAKSGYHGHHSGLSLTSWFKCAGFVKQPPENIWITYFVKNYLGRIHPGFYFIESDWVVAHLTVSHWSPSDVFKRFFYVSMFLKSWTVLQPKPWSVLIKFLKISNLTYKDWHRCIMKVRTLKVASLLIWTSWDLKEWKPCSFPVSKPKLVPFSSI